MAAEGVPAIHMDYFISQLYNMWNTKSRRVKCYAILGHLIGQVFT